MSKISALLHLTKKWILTKFGGHGWKNMLATPIKSFRGFLGEIQILGTLETSNFLQGGFLSSLTLEGMILSIFIS